MTIFYYKALFFAYLCFIALIQSDNRNIISGQVVHRMYINYSRLLSTTCADEKNEILFSVVLLLNIKIIDFYFTFFSGFHFQFFFCKLQCSLFFLFSFSLKNSYTMKYNFQTMPEEKHNK